jgi:shikimate kinase
MKRINNFETRGIAKAKDQCFDDLYKEREILYKKYGEIVIDCNDKKYGEIVEEIISKI